MTEVRAVAPEHAGLVGYERHRGGLLRIDDEVDVVLLDGKAVRQILDPCSGSETPETTMCMPFGGGDTLADTTYGDTSNLMNWSLIGMGSNTGLSGGQGHVLRHSGLVGWP